MPNHLTEEQIDDLLETATGRRPSQENEEERAEQHRRMREALSHYEGFKSVPKRST